MSREMGIDEIRFRIREKLAAYPNSQIIREVESLVDLLHAKKSQSGNKQIITQCFRGYKPNSENCIDCQSRSICELI